tara:strand:- start:293 stop:496 length:204 start_codon:yes stop_codon:yes gene_type:complete
MKYWKLLSYNDEPNRTEKIFIICLMVMIIFSIFLKNIFDHFIIDFILNFSLAIFLFFWAFNIFKKTK